MTSYHQLQWVLLSWKWNKNNNYLCCHSWADRYFHSEVPVKSSGWVDVLGQDPACCPAKGEREDQEEREKECHRSAQRGNAGVWVQPLGEWKETYILNQSRRFRISQSLSSLFLYSGYELTYFLITQTSYLLVACLIWHLHHVACRFVYRAGPQASTKCRVTASHSLLRYTCWWFFTENFLNAFLLLSPLLSSSFCSNPHDWVPYLNLSSHQG